VYCAADGIRACKEQALGELAILILYSDGIPCLGIGDLDFNVSAWAEQTKEALFGGKA